MSDLSATIQDVVSNNLCTGCGTCVGICPAGALEIIETADGRLVPDIQIVRCTACGLCRKTCSQLRVSAELMGVLDSAPAGPIGAACTTTAKNIVFSTAGQSGGATMGILSWAMESGLVDRALVVSVDSNNPLQPRAMLVDNTQNLQQCQGSQYCPVALNVVLREVLDTAGRIACVGLPCHMHSLSLAMENIEAIREKIVLRVGLFCSGTMTFGGRDFLVKSSGVQPGRVQKFAYRDRRWKGWPGDVSVMDDHKQSYYIPRTARMAAKDFFTPIYCRLCPDKMNMTVDISVGDAYGLDTDGVLGGAALLIRTDVGQRVVEQAVRDGYLICQNVSESAVLAGQKSQPAWDRSRDFAAVWQQTGHVLPAFWSETSLPQIISISAGKAARRLLRRSLSWQCGSARRRHVRLPQFLMIGIWRVKLAWNMIQSIVHRRRGNHQSA